MPTRNILDLDFLCYLKCGTQRSKIMIFQRNKFTAWRKATVCEGFICRVIIIIIIIIIYEYRTRSTVNQDVEHKNTDAQLI